MSLLLPNQISVWLHPKQVALKQLGGFKKRVLHKQYASVTQTNEMKWQDSVAQLTHMLDSEKFAKSHLQVTLSSDFVRYLVLPPHTSIQNTNEKAAFARAAFQENYGAVVNHWTVSVDDARPDLNAVAIAVDQALLAAIEKTAQEKQLYLASVQPSLMAAYNRITAAQDQQAFYLALIEKSRILFAIVSNKGWSQVRNLPLEENWSEQLQHLIQREALSAVQPMPHQVKVYAPYQPNATLPAVAGWTISRIVMPGSLPSKQANSSAFAMLEAA